MHPGTTIILTVNCEGEIHHLETFPNEYRNLMMLINDKISSVDFGACLGMQYMFNWHITRNESKRLLPE